MVLAESLQEALPDLGDRDAVSHLSSDLNLILVVSLSAVSLLFVSTVIFVFFFKCRQSRSPPIFITSDKELYSTLGSKAPYNYCSSTLPLPYSYEVCLASESGQKDFTFLRPGAAALSANLLSADPGSGTCSGKDPPSPGSSTQQAQPNTDWRFSQTQRPGTSGSQNGEEAGAWPNNQFDTEMLQAMILASANEAADGNSTLGGGNGTMGLSARYGPQFTLQHVPDYRQNVYIPGSNATLTNAGKRDAKNAAPAGGNKKKSGKKEKK
ncbi:protocadherin gamma-B1-like isoform X16 [Anomalospiza imberbis]|uniref:protocadherin gamma-B1-like isoform X16 n=1 Tax=Anomalospiza imberbis TaxID=187417 RepID=UPI00358E16F4